MTKPATVYIRDASADGAPGVVHQGTRLMIGASVYLGRGVRWNLYEQLYQRVYVALGRYALARNGILLVLQTNAYDTGNFIDRRRLVTSMLEAAKFDLIDERIWERAATSFFQPPFSHVLVFRPPRGTATRGNFATAGWRRGVWRYPQSGQANNAYPAALCRTIVEATTSAGDRVLDPFAGSGRLLAEAARQGREAVGYEIDKNLIPVLRANGVRVVRGDKEPKAKRRLKS